MSMPAPPTSSTRVTATHYLSGWATHAPPCDCLTSPATGYCAPAPPTPSTPDAKTTAAPWGAEPSALAKDIDGLQHDAITGRSAITLFRTATDAFPPRPETSRPLGDTATLRAFYPHGPDHINY